MERIDNKIGRIKEYLSLIRSIQDDCLKRFVSDPLYRGALLHYLYLMADTCIALAELVISQKDFRPPQSYSEAFDILGENGILDPAFAYSFAKIAGFRNFLAHDYEKVNAEQICRAEEINAALGPLYGSTDYRKIDSEKQRPNIWPYGKPLWKLTQKQGSICLQENSRPSKLVLDTKASCVYIDCTVQ